MEYYYMRVMRGVWQVIGQNKPKEKPFAVTRTTTEKQAKKKVKELRGGD